MTNLKLSQIVTEAITLDRDIKSATERLKDLKKMLKTEAESREDERTPTDGGGSSIIFTGEAGDIARVTFPGASLKDKIDGEGKLIEKIKQVAGKLFDHLFRPVIAYRPVEDFRTSAEAVLGRAAEKLIALCEKDSAPTVSFETKEN